MSLRAGCRFWQRYLVARLFRVSVNFILVAIKCIGNVYIHCQKRVFSHPYIDGLDTQSQGYSPILGREWKETMS